MSAVFKGTDSESYEEDISSLHYAASFLPVKLVNMYGPATDFHSDVRFLKSSLSAISEIYVPSCFPLNTV